MANLQKRFIFGSWNQWTGGEGQPSLASNESKYYEAIVFITKTDDPTNGYKIYTHGAYFDTELNSEEVLNLVLPALEHAAGKNIDITYSETEGLTIAAESLSDVKGTYTWITGENGQLEKNYNTLKQDKLVEAQAVADALTSPLTLSAEVSEGKGIFTQTFNTLNGTEVEAPTAVIEAGSNILLEQTKTGIKISNTYVAPEVEIPEYKDGTGITIGDDLSINHTNSVTAVTAEDNSKTLSATDKSFTVKSYSFDSEGHITAAPVESTITLPEEAFKNDNTEYEFSLVKNDTNDFSLNLVNADTKDVVDTFSVKGEGIAITQGTGKNIFLTALSQTSDLNVADAAVENEYVSAVTQVNGKIDVQRLKLPVYDVDTTTVDGLKLTLADGKVSLADDGLGADLTSKNITLTTKETPNTGYLKTYVLTQGTTTVGEIDLPKDLVVKSGAVVLHDGEQCLELTLTSDDVIHIPVKDLVDAYTAGNGIIISDNNEISVKLHEGDKYLGFDDDKCLVTKVGELHVMDVEDSAGSNTYHSGAVVKTSGLATVENVANIINRLDSDVDARVYNENGIGLADLADGEIAVVTGITQYNGIITSVDGAAVVTKTYVDNAIGKAAPATGTVSLGNGEKGSYVFAEEIAGYVTAEHMAAIMNEAWSWGTI